MKKLGFILFCLFTLQAAHALPLPYQDGDIIFQESQTDQSRAIKEATNSRWSHVGILFSDHGHWVVAEAVQPVRITPLSNFISRGKNKAYKILRLPSLAPAQKQELRAQAKAFMGKKYDIYFEWSDELIYCSELVYKTFLKATGVEIGSVQKFRDMQLDGPYVQELIRRRLTDTGRELDLEEAIVTPASQILDPKLELVEKFER